MKTSIYSLLIFAFCSACQKNNTATRGSLGIQTVDSLAVPASVRALQAVSLDEIWFAGSEGVFGHTQDAGQSWRIDSITTDSTAPHFRSLAVTETATHLLSIASPALLFRSTDRGANWKIVYREDHPAAFYDAMQFWDDQYGIAMGDPTDGCLSVIRTEDGGANWEKVPCTQIPTAVEGEAAFAASNSNLALQPGGKVWMVSGGAAARVYFSEDYGQNWQVYNSPIVSGGQMTGIYTVDFYDEQAGIIFGGNWNEKATNRQNKAITTDGGQSWQLISDGSAPGYQSCVKYLPGGEGQQLISCGIPGVHYSLDGGMSWDTLLTESYYTLSVADSHTLWLAGNQKLAKVDLQKKGGE
ncbi:MAG TPA: hypothetical protein VJ953_17605 [Saprospiraceae bacterium]|nr:hypothetical protein [Saprospiraceae bacterium]